MNWSRYKFSKESEPELQEFFKAVAAQNCARNSDIVLWDKLLPVDEVIKQQISCYSTNVINNVIDITDTDDENIVNDDNNKNTLLHPQEEFILPDQSFTELTLNGSKLNTTTREGLIDGVQELLQTESFLSDDIIKQFGSELSLKRLQEIFTLFVTNLNSECTLKLWKSIITANCVERSIVANCFAHYILIPKILSENDDCVKVLFKEVFVTFPDELLAILKQILFESYDTKKDLTILRNNIDTLSNEYKNSLLRVFNCHYTKLESHHLVTMLNLITPQIDIENLNHLLELMFTVARDFASEKVFGKLLLALLQVLGPNILPNEQLLRSIISTHKSIFKSQIVKYFEISLQDQKLLS